MTTLIADVGAKQSVRNESTKGTLGALIFLIHQVGAATSIQFATLMRDLTSSCSIRFCTMR